MRPKTEVKVATADLTNVLGRTGSRYELLAHAHTETAIATAKALGVSPAEVAKTLIVKA
jgi:prolyl-tRNA editing enzyme YbaK/EbsC (Cys-tRNA(Pro) deacylase)